MKFELNAMGHICPISLKGLTCQILVTSVADLWGVTGAT